MIKKYLYKVYDTDGTTYITTWDDVVSAPSFSKIINGSLTDMTVSLTRKFDAFGEDDDVKLNNRVMIYVIDCDAVNGAILYDGYISGYQPVMTESGEYVEVTLMPWNTQLEENILLTAAGHTTVPYSTAYLNNVVKSLDDNASVRVSFGSNYNYIQEDWLATYKDAAATTADWNPNLGTFGRLRLMPTNITATDSYSESNYSASRRISSTLGNSSIGQSFTAGENKDLFSVKFYLSKSGSPTGSAVAKIYAHSGVYGTSSVPTGSALMTSTPLDVSTLTSSMALVEFYFPEYALTSGSYYVVQLEYTNGNALNYINIAVDTTSPTHSGNYCYYAGGSWQYEATTDTCFYVDVCDYDTTKNTGQSIKVNTATENIRFVYVAPTAVTPVGTSVDYYMSNDGGTTWELVAVNTNHAFRSAGNDLRFKAVLNGTSTVTPYVEVIDILYGNIGWLEGYTVSYTFNTSTILSALQKCQELAPTGWYYYIGADNIVRFLPQSTDYQHKLTIGVNLAEVRPMKRMENVKNTVLFVGNGIFKKYVRSGSVTTYGVRTYVYQDNRVSLETTADILAGNFLDNHESAEIRTKIRVFDNNLDPETGYDIESIDPGQMILLKGFGVDYPLPLYDQSLYDVAYYDFSIAGSQATAMQVVSVKYTPDYVDIELSSRPTPVNRRVEDIYRNLVNYLNTSNPSTPTT